MSFVPILSFDTRVLARRHRDRTVSGNCQCASRWRSGGYVDRLHRDGFSLLRCNGEGIRFLESVYLADISRTDLSRRDDRISTDSGRTFVVGRAVCRSSVVFRPRLALL